jgi:hypothetical protein
MLTVADADICNGGTLYLPKNFTIYVDANVQSINWKFSKVIFEEGATIDLSQRQIAYTKPTTPPPNNNPFYSRNCPPDNCADVIETQTINGRTIRNVGENGKKGRDGKDGDNGADGKYFSLVTYFLSNTGNLWIRTDGSNGQDGGDGGDGGYGARGSCNGTLSHGIDGGVGGDGGFGGKGGKGGSTSLAMLQFLDVSNTPIKVYSSIDGDNCNPSTRPNPLNGNNSGLIVISGNPGCGGIGGIGGKAGDYGHGCMCGCASTNTSNDGRHEAAKSHDMERMPNGKNGLINNVFIKIN